MLLFCRKLLVASYSLKTKTQSPPEAYEILCDMAHGSLHDSVSPLLTLV